MSDEARSQSRSQTGRWSGRVGPYELREELARGGMGVVYRAWDPGTEREVALKLLLAARAGPQVEELRRKRVLREAETLARMHHPNVVAVHASGEHQGIPYVVLELVEGESLDRRLLREGRLRPADVARLGAKLASALSHAHTQGVLHRDVKPGNVLVRTRDGEPLLSDFGLALDLLGSTTRLSQAGSFLGTPQYWPPEQARGELEKLGSWSDVYALGATLYHLATGRTAHEGVTLPELVGAAEGKKVPVRELAPDVGPDLAIAIERCLEPDPRARPELAWLEAELLRVAARPTSALRRRRTNRRALLTGGLVLAMGALAALAAWWAVPAASLPRDPGHVPAALPTAQALVAPDPWALPAGWERLPIDAALLRDATRHPALEAWAPWSISFPAEGVIRLCSGGDERPELRLPLDCSAGPFRLRLVCAIPSMEVGTALNLCLEPAPDAPVPWEPARLFLSGGDQGDERLMFSAIIGEEERLAFCERTALPGARPELVLELEYGGRAAPRLTFRCEGGPGGEAHQVEREVAPLPAGVRWVRVGLNLHNARDAFALRFATVDVHRLELSGPRGTFTAIRPLDAHAHKIGRLGRGYAGGAMEEVARTGEQLGIEATTANESNLFPTAAFQGALSLARLGRHEEAAIKLQAFHKSASLERDMLKRSGSWYEKLVARALGRLGPEERRALAQANLLGHPELATDVDGRLELARRLHREAISLRAGFPEAALLRFADAALLMAEAGLDQPGKAPLELAEAWFNLGDFERARELYAARGEVQARVGQGFAAYRLARWEEAVDVLEKLPWDTLPPDQRGRLEEYLRQARQRR